MPKVSVPAVVVSFPEEVTTVGQGGGLGKWSPVHDSVPPPQRVSHLLVEVLVRVREERKFTHGDR